MTPAMTQFRLLDTGRLPAAANMALDKIILDCVADGASPPTFRFLQFRPAAALVGYHQDAALEVRLAYCRDHGIDVNRRHTGGGSIFFQESALGWEIFGLLGEPPFRGSYENILYSVCTTAAAGLSRLGINAEFRPRNDIEVDGRKISGTGGVTVSGGFMFQGTVLVENEVELFLKALRAPVEKLKKRELESLMERICFLSDLVRPAVQLSDIKEAMAAEFSDRLGVTLLPGGLTAEEQRRLPQETKFHESPEWIMARSRPAHEGEPARSITQTEAGTLRVHLWPAPGGRRVRQALIAGDFFSVPRRLVHDLEAALIGLPMAKEPLQQAVRSFFNGYDGQVLGISPDMIGDAVAAAAERLTLTGREFTLTEINDLFFINLRPDELRMHRPEWLLLPYCSKSLECGYRTVPGCAECGDCEIGDCCLMARSMGIKPITIQSFEHLMEVLRKECCHGSGIYVGSCCEAFYAKHQKEMKEVGARGILVNLDSTTCYDLGKGSQAYKGHFDNKTSLNMGLIEKTLKLLNGQTC